VARRVGRSARAAGAAARRQDATPRRHGADPRRRRTDGDRRGAVQRHRRAVGDGGRRRGDPAGSAPHGRLLAPRPRRSRVADHRRLGRLRARTAGAAGRRRAMDATGAGRRVARPGGPMNATPHAVVFAAGSLPVPPRRTAVLAGAKIVIAADGGLAHAIALGWEPDLVVGDMDSVRERDLASVPEARIDRHPRAKDDLDLELALDSARDRGARRIDVVGAFGSRLDQSLAALLIAARHAREGVDVRLHGGAYEGRVVPSGGKASLTLPARTVVSLLALTEDVIVSTSGLRYPLDRAPLPYGRGLGLSNEVATPQRDATEGSEAGADRPTVVTVETHGGT